MKVFIFLFLFLSGTFGVAETLSEADQKQIARVFRACDQAFQTDEVALFPEGSFSSSAMTNLPEGNVVISFRYSPTAWRAIRAALDVMLDQDLVVTDERYGHSEVRGKVMGRREFEKFKSEIPGGKLRCLSAGTRVPTCGELEKEFAKMISDVPLQECGADSWPPKPSRTNTLRPQYRLIIQYLLKNQYAYDRKAGRWTSGAILR